MPELVLVTDGSGYITDWCVAELLRRGCAVRTTVRGPDREQAVTDAVSTVVDPAGRLGFAVADLTEDDGWDAALKGVDRVLHVASPLGGAGKDPDALIAPARDGVLRVLRAATAAGVKRVVMTSAANAANPSSYATQGVTDETLWPDPEDPTLIPYRRSKTLAERAAWDFMESHHGPTELATVLPGAVFGPVLTTGNIGSVGIIGRMVSGAMYGIPRIGLEIVDVRDLVDVHIRAMTSPHAAGERFLATGEFLCMADMARILREGLGERGRRVPTRQVPDVVVRLAARFRDPSLREITPALGRRNRHSIEKAGRFLGWQPRPARETVLDCAESLIAHGAVQGVPER
jgi:nucleoside-diphosphate-sugar epimerase